MAHWRIGALGALGHWGIGAFAWRIGAFCALRHDPNLDPNQVISELMRESADLPDLVQARLALSPIPNPAP